MKFNEDSRVKIPTILHLMRLGYEYLSLSNHKWDESTNIFSAIFKTNLLRLNPELSSGDVNRVCDEVALSIQNEDLGKVFYKKVESLYQKKFALTTRETKNSHRYAIGCCLC